MKKMTARITLSILMSCYVISACSTETAEVVSIATQIPNYSNTSTPYSSPSPSLTPSPTFTPTSTEIPKDQFADDLIDYNTMVDYCKGGVFTGQTTLWEADVSGVTVGELTEKGISACYIEAVGAEEVDPLPIYSAIVAQDGAVRDPATNNLLGPDHLNGLVQLYFDSGIDVSESLDARVVKGVQPFSIQGVVFNDLNSSFARDKGEPRLDIGTVCALVEQTTGPNRGTIDEYCSETDEQGHFFIKGFSSVNLNKGYQLVIRSDIETDLRYINFPDGSTAFITGPIEMVYETTELDIPLDRGFLNSVLNLEELDFVPITDNFTDHDLREGYVLTWTGDTTVDNWDAVQESWDDISPYTYDQSQGHDIALPIGTEIQAAANGIIKYSGGGPEFGNVRGIVQLVDIPGENSIYLLQYTHNSKNLVIARDRVNRNQIIALSGNNGGGGVDGAVTPHLEFKVVDVPREIWDQFGYSDNLFEYLASRGVDLPDGQHVYRDHGPFLNELWLQGNTIVGRDL